MPDVRRPPVLVSTVVAVLLGVAYLAAPPMGTDLSAQVARARFFDAYGGVALDFGWYGGVSPYGYSLVSPQLMAWLGGDLQGPRVLGVLAAVLSSAVFAALLIRTDATRPLLGGVLGAACVYGNLVSGRITYALGVAFGLLALLAVTSQNRWWRTGGAVAGAVLATLTSPVAGLFVGLAGAAWTLAVLTGGRANAPRRGTGLTGGRANAPRRGAGLTGGRANAPRRGAGLTGGVALMAGAALAMVAMALVFGAGGWMNISRWDTARAAGASLAVALLVPRPAIRIGALFSAVGVLAAYAVHTPVGLNATRLAAMFALPVLAAYATLPWLLNRAGGAWSLNRAGGAPPASRAVWVRALGLTVVLVSVGLWQPPVMTGDLRAAGDPAAQPGYHAGLRGELIRRAPAGRVEAVPLANYWDAAYLPSAAPLARGWLRQADLAHNPIFYDGSLTAAEYEHWLRDNGVGYVALSEAAPSWVGRAEAKLIRSGLPYLSEVWRDGHWTLYEVAGRPSIVEDARLVAATQAGVTVDASRGDALVRVRWSPWLSVRELPSLGPQGSPASQASPAAQAPPAPSGTAGACLVRDGAWVTLRVDRPGRYQVTASLTGRGPFCPGATG